MGDRRQDGLSARRGHRASMPSAARETRRVFRHCRWQHATPRRRRRAHPGEARLAASGASLSPLRVRSTSCDGTPVARRRRHPRQVLRRWGLSHARARPTPGCRRARLARRAWHGGSAHPEALPSGRRSSSRTPRSSGAGSQRTTTPPPSCGWASTGRATPRPASPGRPRCGRRCAGAGSTAWPQGIDEHTRRQRWTPRKPASNWSTININAVAELTAQGRMQPSGLAAFERRREDRSGVYAYENRERELPAALRRPARRRPGGHRLLGGRDRHLPQARRQLGRHGQAGEDPRRPDGPAGRRLRRRPDDQATALRHPTEVGRAGGSGGGGGPPRVSP